MMTFFFVVGLVLVCALISAPVTAIVFASYDVLLELAMVLHPWTGSRRLQFWEVIAKVDFSDAHPMQCFCYSHLHDRRSLLQTTHCHPPQNLSFLKRYKLAVVSEEVLELVQTELASGRSGRSTRPRVCVTADDVCVCVCVRVHVWVCVCVWCCPANASDHSLRLDQRTRLKDQTQQTRQVQSWTLS
jgi:hypothetical protein